MARRTNMLIFVLLVCSVLVSDAINCRRYAFAPACRGIMIKRAGGRSAALLAEQLESEVGRPLTEILLQIQNSVEEMKLLMQNLNKSCESETIKS